MVRGEIYFMDLAPRSGSEQSGRRPCILVSHDAFTANPRWRSVTVVPMTFAHQITTLDKDKIVEPAIGRVPESKLEEVARAVASYLGLS